MDVILDLLLVCAGLSLGHNAADDNNASFEDLRLEISDAALEVGVLNLRNDIGALASNNLILLLERPKQPLPASCELLLATSHKVTLELAEAVRKGNPLGARERHKGVGDVSFALCLGLLGSRFRHRGETSLGGTRHDAADSRGATEHCF